MRIALDRKSRWPASVTVFALMILFPPWLYNDGYTSNQASAGYHFVFTPPRVKTYEEMFGVSTDLPTEFVRVRFNYLRLAVQLLTLWFLSAGASLAAKGGSKWESRCLLSLGVLGVLLLILLMISRF
jgi:hypothetical protein